MSDHEKITADDAIAHLARARNVEANRAAEMEAQANREKARADAAEQMVVELRDVLKQARPIIHTEPGSRWMQRDDLHLKVDTALASTAEVAGRWCPVPQRPLLDGLRRCTACGVTWSVWGPSTVQPHGSMSVHGRSCVACEPSGSESAVFERVEISELVAERDAAIAARDEAVAAFERSGAKGLVAMAQCDAAIRARDEVGIQLAAAQVEIARMRPVVEAARPVSLTWSDPYVDRMMQPIRDALRALDAVPGDALAPPPVRVQTPDLGIPVVVYDEQVDALAPTFTAALEASGIDTANVKGGE